MRSTVPKDIKGSMPPFMREGIQKWVRENPEEARDRLLKVRAEILTMVTPGTPRSVINKVVDAQADQWGCPRLPPLE